MRQRRVLFQTGGCTCLCSKIILHRRKRKGRSRGWRGHTLPAVTRPFHGNAAPEGVSTRVDFVSAPLFAYVAAGSPEERVYRMHTPQAVLRSKGAKTPCGDAARAVQHGCHTDCAGAARSRPALPRGGRPSLDPAFEGFCLRMAIRAPHSLEQHCFFLQGALSL